MTKHFWLSFSVIVLAAHQATAGPVKFIERAPADPAQISVAVDQLQLIGTLSKSDLADLIEAGRQLFDTKFSQSDGVGRPLATQANLPTHFKHARSVIFQRTSGPESNRCTSCHNDPIAGGAGDFTANAFTSEGTESADFDTVDPQFSNERGTNHMFGAGLIELLAREMTTDLLAQKRATIATAKSTGQNSTVSLHTKGVNFGQLTVHPNGELDVSNVEGIDADLVVRPFSQKGVVPSLRKFTVGALNAHHGIQADERFSSSLTGETDFDGDGVPNEFSAGQVSALVAYQASLPAPLAIKFDNNNWQASADRGQKVFEQLACTTCHISTLPLSNLTLSDPGPYDTAGTLSERDVAQPATYDLSLLAWADNLPRNGKGEILVPLFSDLKRHVIADGQNPHFANELMGQSFVPRDVFMTAELWGVADTAPYGHRADLTDLSQVILAHGGEAASARDAFANLPRSEKDDIITYLKTLRMPQ